MSTTESGGATTSRITNSTPVSRLKTPSRMLTTHAQRRPRRRPFAISSTMTTSIATSMTEPSAASVWPKGPSVGTTNVSTMIARIVRMPTKAMSRCSRTVVRWMRSDRSTASTMPTARACSRSASEPQKKSVTNEKPRMITHARVRQGAVSRPAAAAMQAIVPPEAPTSSTSASACAHGHGSIANSQSRRALPKIAKS